MSPAVASSARSDALLRSIELDVWRRLDGLLHGDYRGLVPGQGSEHGETRPYVAGDDTRRIDWNVSARTLDTQIREDIADRELETWVLVDRSPSLDFGTAAMTKADLAVTAVGAIGFLTARTANRLGAVIVGGPHPVVVPAKQGRLHLQALLHRVVTTPTAVSGASTDLAAALQHLVVPPRRRGLAVVVSDFLSASTWTGPIRALSQRHDVVAVEIVDPRELELPAVGTLTLADPETGRVREVPTNARTRRRYAEAAAQQRQEIADALRTSGAAHVQLRTDRDWVLDLANFVLRRRRIGSGRR